MALFHLSVTQVKRSAGQSAIASAAYRAGERLYSERYGEYSDYTRKGGVICSDILPPPQAPPEYQDRQTLWNAVENAERGKDAQLAYSFDIALQNEFSLEENIALARQFLLEQFVSRGMVVDFAVHQPDRDDGGIPNPHFHVLCPIRPIREDGKWGFKQRRVYRLDEDGNRILDSKGKPLFDAVPTTDWGSPETLEHWREAWAKMCNAKFEEKGLPCRIDHRSYLRQSLDLLPTVHEGPGGAADGGAGDRHRQGQPQPLDQGCQRPLERLEAEDRRPAGLAGRGAGGAFQAAGPRPCRPAGGLLWGKERRCMEQPGQGGQSPKVCRHRELPDRAEALHRGRFGGPRHFPQ